MKKSFIHISFGPFLKNTNHNKDKIKLKINMYTLKDYTDKWEVTKKQ
jgi:hypothetical protein